MGILRPTNNIGTAVDVQTGQLVSVAPTVSTVSPNTGQTIGTVPRPIGVSPNLGPVSTVNTIGVSPNAGQTLGNAAAGETVGGINILDSTVQNLVNQQLLNLATVNQLTGRVFTRFDLAGDVVPNQKTFVTTGLFSGNAATMSAMYTGSLQTDTQKKYYYEVWNGVTQTSEPQFSITYGHRLGSGSAADGTLNDSPTRAIYSQYRLLLLTPGDTTFTFGNSNNSDSIYVINFNRDRVKDAVDPGNWEFTIGDLSGSFFANNIHTGSNVKFAGSKKIKLIDDSNDTQESLRGNIGRVYNIVSGTLLGGIYNSANPHYYGLFYPDFGVMVLNGESLDASMSFNTVTGSDLPGDNSWKLFNAMSGAMQANNTDDVFQARNRETVTSTHYFVRVKNGEYNFSNNPSFVTGSVGEFKQPTFIGDPRVYVTTIGMYNDRQELLAVAKLSTPILKSFHNELLVKVKLDF